MSLNINKSLICILCGIALIATAGCTTIKIETDSETKAHSPVQYVLPPPLLGQADAAWRLGDMKTAENLYSHLRTDPRLPASEYKTVFLRLNEASLVNGNIFVAVDALRTWAMVTQNATSDEAWLMAWGQTMLKAPSETAIAQAKSVMNDMLAQPVLRSQALSLLIVRGSAEERLDMIEHIKALYVTSEKPQQAFMERGLLSMLEDMTAKDLVEILQNTTPETDKSFPWSVLLLEKARREARSFTASNDSVSPTLQRINSVGVFASLNLVEETMSKAQTRQEIIPITSDVPLYPSTVALALPLSGNYHSIGQKIAAGAQAARAELTKNGVTTEVILIDTDEDQWVEKIKLLPEECVVVGGPIFSSDYAQVKEHKLYEDKAFFAFISALDANDEGRLAWRFFPTPRDQIDALLKYATQAGITSFATLYPDEPYGHRMADLFLEATPGGTLNSMLSRNMSYPPDKNDISKWNDIVNQLVGGTMIGKTPVSSADFQAIFLPDSWDKASLLIPYLFFNGEDRLLILGSSLWGQAVSKGVPLDSSNLRLVVYPSGWNSAEPTPAAQNLSVLLGGEEEPDFWSGLGYDFVHFVAALHISPKWSHLSMNNKLSTASHITWSMAPISWDERGRAHQSLFVLNPSKSGDKIVTPQDMSKRLDSVRQRYERRIEAARKKEEATTSARKN